MFDHRALLSAHEGRYYWPAIATMPPIKMLTVTILREIDQSELLGLHRRVHQLAARLRSKVSPTTSDVHLPGRLGEATPLTTDWLVRAHRLIVGEMTRRGIRHVAHDWLDASPSELGKTPEIPETVPAERYHYDSIGALHASLPTEVVVQPEWLSVSGGLVYARDRDPKDVDLIARWMEGLPEGSRLKLERLFSFLTGREVHWNPEPGGPSWAYAPLYDLVARKVPEPLIRDLDEPEVAALLYKQRGVVTDISRIQVGTPVAHYSVGGEFYSGDENELWDKFARRAVERNVPLLVQQKYDGFRFHVHRKGDILAVFSDNGLDRVSVFPVLADVLPAGEYIVDCEFMELEKPGGAPRPRWDMAWMGSAKEPPDPYPPLRVAVHDLIWHDGKNLADQPYVRRLAVLRRLLPELRRSGGVEAEMAQTRKADDRRSFQAAIGWAKAEPGSEGAMIKYADFRYKPGVVGEVAKYKVMVEIDVLAIGYRKVPAAKPAGERWTRAQALRRLPDLLRRSDTYIFRVALRSGRKLVPLESDGTLAPKDITLDWDVERQQWTGTDDPKFWTMWHNVAEREQGDLKFANTYALRVEPGDLTEGMVLTVAPAKMRVFSRPDGGEGYAWMFPRARNVKPPGSAVGQLSDVLSAFGAENEVEKGTRQLFGSPGGKWALAGRLIKLIPPHNTYVEPFAGGAAVLFAKEPGSREVLADADPDIVAAYRTVKGLTDGEIGELERMDWRVDSFESIKASTPRSKLGRFHKWLVLRKANHGFTGSSRNTGRKPGDRVSPPLRAVRDRLKSVSILQGDYARVLTRFDASDTFFYLDPPYPDSSLGAARADLRWRYSDVERLVEVIKRLKGKWLLSLSDTAQNRKLFQGLHLRSIAVGTVFNTGGHEHGAKRQRRELLIANFPLPKQVRRPMAKLTSRALSTDHYPDEAIRYPFVLHAHWRGRSVHLDFRFKLDGVLEGWTVAAAQPDAVKEPVTTVAAARVALHDAGAWKLDWRRGRVLPRRVRTTVAGEPREVVRPGALRALPKKAEIPEEWLTVEGVTDRADPGEPVPVGATRQYPGVFLIADKGQVEFGARKPWFFEYFLSGSRFSGRYLFRLIGGVDGMNKQRVLPPGVPESDRRQPGYWVWTKPDSELPYVLSPEAVDKGWLPPQGVSALPRRLRERVPSDLQYWRVTGDQALARRRTLAEKFEELGGPTLMKGMRAVFGSPGSKRYMAKTLERLIPPHNTYVEPFAGGAALFWRKELSEQEVLADTDGRIMGVYAFLQKASERELRELAGRSWESTEPRFQKLLAEKPQDRVQRAYRHLYLFRNGWHLAGDVRAGNFRHSRDGMSSDFSMGRLQAWQARLKDVRLRRQDVMRTIKEFDGPETFFYIDPPYTSGRSEGLWQEDHDQFGEQDWRRLITVLGKIKGKFLLSMNRETYKVLAPWPSGWQKRLIKTRHPVGGGGGKTSAQAAEASQRVIFEVVVGNYPLRRRRSTTAKAVSPRFVLQRHWWKGPRVVRLGPSTEHYDLRVQVGPDDFLHFMLDGDPRQGTVAGHERRMNGDLEVEDVGGKLHPVMGLRGRVALKPGGRGGENPTKNTPAFLEMVDFGRAEVLEREEDHVKVRLHGRDPATLFLARESPGSLIWQASVSSGPVTKAWQVEIAKVDPDRQLVYGVVLKPDEVDAQQDRASAEEIEQAAHRFLRRSRLMDLQHAETLTADRAAPVESYIAPQDLEWEHDGGSRVIHKGSWILVTHVADPKVWDMVKEGQINAYSIRGFGVRRPSGNGGEHARR